MVFNVYVDHAMNQGTHFEPYWPKLQPLMYIFKFKFLSHYQYNSKVFMKIL